LPGAGLVLALVAGVLSPAPASAQIPNASAAALGMGGNHAAVARGYAAVAWNPAMLGLPGGPGSSFALLPFTVGAGLHTLRLGSLADFAGDSVPRAERERWLTDIERQGGERGDAGGDVTFLAASRGPFAFQLSTVAYATADLSPGAAELVLFGNAGRTGEACTCLLDGSTLDGHAISTGAVSFGFPIEWEQGSPAALGVTLKYSVGHGLVHGVDLGSALTPDARVDVGFPTITTDAGSFRNSGSGWGVDLGFAVVERGVTYSVAMQNVVHGFRWDTERLRYRPGTAVFNRDVQRADFDEAPFESAPLQLRELVEGLRFNRVLSFAMARSAGSALTLSADYRRRLGEGGIDGGPARHVGGGAEYRLPFVALQAGGALLSDGYQIGGGAGLTLGPIKVGAALLHRGGDAGSGLRATLTLISTQR